MSPSRGLVCSRALVQALLALPLLLPTASAVSNDDLISYLGGSATGQSLSTVAYTLTALANDSHVVVSLALDKQRSEVGWIGWGRGTAMTDACVPLCPPEALTSRVQLASD